jgi:tetratricopeptide (TPR) repeat protein
VHQGAYPAAEEIAGRALGEAACEPIAAAQCRHALGAIAHARRERSAARLHYEWALAERRRLADSMGAYYSAMSLAFLELESDNLTKARAYANESSRLCHATGHLGGMLSVHACTGGIAAKEGRQSAALESYRQAVEVEETVRHPQLKAATFVKLGEIYSSRSQFDRACASYGEALELADAVGDARIAINARVGLGRSLRLRGEAERAKSVLRTALKQALALASHAQLADALSEFASVARGMGDYKTPARIADTLRALRLDQMKSEALALMAEFVGPRPPPEAQVETEVLELINEPEFGVVHL